MSFSARSSRALALSLVLAACAPAATRPETPVLADRIVEAPGATGEGFGDANLAIDGVMGGGYLAGSLDVYSLGYDERPYLVLGWTGARVTNGAGADFVVFENPFRTTWSPDEWFMDPVVVEVSRDGVGWVPLPHDYLAADESAYSTHPEDWQGFAGVTPVLLGSADGPSDAFDPRAGGDAFDLDELALDGEAGAIRREGFRFVRLTSAAIVTNPDTSLPFPHERVSNGADIDGVYARWLVPDEGPSR